MYIETKEIIRERIERMRARFQNAGLDVLPECETALAEIEACGTVEQCLEKEKTLIAHLELKFPVLPDDVNSRLAIGQFAFNYTDARYDSKSQHIA